MSGNGHLFGIRWCLDTGPGTRNIRGHIGWLVINAHPAYTSVFTIWTDVYSFYVEWVSKSPLLKCYWALLHTKCVAEDPYGTVDVTYASFVKTYGRPSSSQGFYLKLGDTSVTWGVIRHNYVSTFTDDPSEAYPIFLIQLSKAA